LFAKVPARLKFLKSQATENSHIADVVSKYALAFPEIKFTLAIEGRETLVTPGSGKLIDSEVEVYGLEVTRNMLEIKMDKKWKVKSAASSLVITGMISLPAMSRSNRSYLSFFVNRRWINSRVLAWAVEQAYHGLLMKGKHPVAVINISLPQKEVDINIHPTKTEVKFQKEHEVFGAVQKAVRQTLIEQMPVPKIEEVATTYQTPSKARQVFWPSTTGSSHPFTFPQTVRQTPAVSLPMLKVIGQLLSSYIIAEGTDGLYIIDQHAAHERILFEQIKQQSSHQEVDIQGLLVPVTLEVSPKQEENLKTYFENLVGFGFSVESFGDRTYLFRAVPSLLHNKDWIGMIMELLDSVPEGDKTDWGESIAISMACHSAIRAGQTLTDNELGELISQLVQVTIPNTCPHGRPTIIHLSSEQLKREFGRN
jgi:DNA mismatch repair protein MutL